MRRRIGSQQLQLAVGILVVWMAPSLAQAHIGIGDASGLFSGLAHPVLGWDHVCAMLAVGLWASQRGGRAIWLVPLVFLTVMAVGGMLGMTAVSIPHVETGLVASVLILGMMLAAAVRLPVVASVLIVGLFALLHGHAHGMEMPATASGVSYGLGFMATTAALQSCGIAIGLLARRHGVPQLVRYAGGAIAACGAMMWFV
jgi:urease accessory protein